MHCIFYCHVLQATPNDIPSNICIITFPSKHTINFVCNKTILLTNRNVTCFHFTHPPSLGSCLGPTSQASWTKVPLNASPYLIFMFQKNLNIFKRVKFGQGLLFTLLSQRFVIHVSLQLMKWEYIWECWDSLPCIIPHLWEYVWAQRNFLYPLLFSCFNISHKPKVRVMTTIMKTWTWPMLYKFIYLPKPLVPIFILFKKLEFICMQVLAWFFPI
jgi:hypothetical protein